MVVCGIAVSHDQPKEAIMSVLAKLLFFVLYFLRPVVKLPLRFVSGIGLVMFLLTLLVHAGFTAVAFFFIVGLGSLMLSWFYDTILFALSGDESLILAE
jgi:hypothetical protein